VLMTLKLDADFLKILICPVSHCTLIQDGDYLVSTDPETRRRYPIIDGIPDLMIDDSVELDETAWQEIMNRNP
jgi:uncharacterized protein YbaR (Trm112 family)